MTRITDFDAAYENGRHIAQSVTYPARWSIAADQFRASHPGEIDVAYGATPRSVYDLFLPASPPRGVLVFVHGGYWIDFDKSSWSHLAAGPLARGWAVAIPSYDLCPQTGIPQIITQIAAAVAHAAAKVAGPVVLSGHSAGGHLVTALGCADTPLPGPVAARVGHIISISGVHDLRPLLATRMNAQLGLTAQTAAAHSPALKQPLPHLRLTAWVGADERPEFLRQTALLANIWRGLGCDTLAITEPDRHHFNVIDGLTDARSALLRSLD